MSGSSPSRIAAAVVQRTDGKVLLLKRAPTHSTNPNKWCFVTGHVEEGEQPREAAIRELAEEVGLRADPVRSGEIVVVHAEWGVTLNVYPFLFRAEQPNIAIEHEHSEFVWIEPQELYGYDFVQQLDEDLISLGLLARR